MAASAIPSSVESPLAIVLLRKVCVMQYVGPVCGRSALTQCAQPELVGHFSGKTLHSSNVETHIIHKLLEEVYPTPTIHNCETCNYRDLIYSCNRKLNNRVVSLKLENTTASIRGKLYGHST